MPRTQRDWTSREWELHFKGIDPDVYFYADRQEERNRKPGRTQENLPPGASRRYGEILQTNVESWSGMITDDVHLTINRYGKDDNKVQVLIANLRTEHTASGTMPINEIDRFIAENYE